MTSCDALPYPLQKGSPQYQLLTVPEHSPRGTLVGNVTGAVDADEGSNAIVYYFIAGGASRGQSPPYPGAGDDPNMPCPALAPPPHPVPWSHLQLGMKRRTSTFSLTGVCWC